MIPLEKIQQAVVRLKETVTHTPLQESITLSEDYQAQIFLKREDLQVVRSYKLRGALNKILSLSEEQRNKGVVCASAGNHAQGVAFSCRKLNLHGTIFMPVTTPQQKVKQVKFFGRDNVTVILKGDTFDDAQRLADELCLKNQLTFVHPFDDEKVMEGQATVGFEILQDAPQKIDYLIFPVGGGGLASGLISYFKQMSPETKLIGVEPAGAPSMSLSLKNGKNTTLDTLDKFVDGAAVKRVGETAFQICQSNLDKMCTVTEGRVCTSILDLYNRMAIVAEPAGALSVAVLDQLKEEIKGKTVVCVLSGGNNDISRTEEIRERSLMDQGLKHYFIIRFPQRPGALSQFVTDVLKPGDDIVHFEYIKKNNRENGPAFIGLELADSERLNLLKKSLSELNFEFEYLNDKNHILPYLI